MSVREVLAWLERRGTARNRRGMARYGIRPGKAFGVSMATMRPLVRRVGRDHRMALALWKTGWHEARILASLVDEPARVTPRQMDSWCRDLDSWAVCDSVCGHLFSRTPYAWRKVRPWARRRHEFTRRAAFALLANLTVHDKRATDDEFRACLPVIEAAARDDRNFVKKAVNWALRQIGKRSHGLHADAVAVAERLADSSNPGARWVGRDALRELRRGAVRTRMARKAVRLGTAAAGG